MFQKSTPALMVLYLVPYHAIPAPTQVNMIGKILFIEKKYWKGEEVSEVRSFTVSSETIKIPNTLIWYLQALGSMKNLKQGLFKKRRKTTKLQNGPCLLFVPPPQLIHRNAVKCMLKWKTRMQILLS